MEVSQADQYLESFQNQLGPDRFQSVLDQFSGKKSIHEMFSFLWDDEDAHRSLTPKLIISEKSEAVSQKLLAEGDGHYKRGDFDKALEKYNLSLMSAEGPASPLSKDILITHDDNIPESKEFKTMALCYVRRSNVLFVLQQYDKCLLDIDRALICGCSEQDRKSLEDLRFKCQTKQQIDKTTMNDQPNTDEDEVDYDDLYSMAMKCSQPPRTSKTSSEILKSSQKTRQLPEVIEAHENIPALSRALKLNYTPFKGRHLVAERDIEPGEVVGIEKSFCCAVYNDAFNRYCNTCLMQCLTPVPCPNCSLVVFCNEDCRSKGLSGVHGRECNILPTVATLDKKENVVASMAFKLMMNMNYSQLQDYLPVLQQEAKDLEPINLGFDRDGFYSSTDYRPVYHLVGNKNMRSSTELYEIGATAFMLTKLLEQDQEFFRSQDGCQMTPTQDDLLTIGQVFFRHLLNIYCNAFQLSNMTLTPIPIKTMLRVYGEGIFPGLSLFNHSCNPDVRHYNHGDRLVLRAVKPILAGEEVTTTYCGSFYMEDYDTRKEYLQSSYIDCTCEACVGKWPVLSKLPMEMVVKCTRCSTPMSDICQSPRCPSCLLNFDRSYPEGKEKHMVENWRELMQDVEDGQRESQFILLRKKTGQPVLPQDIKLLSNFLKLLQEHVTLPCQSFCYAMDTLFLVFCLQYCSPNT